MAKFLNNVRSEDLGYFESRLVRKLIDPLIWVHEDKRIEIPTDFESDGASVPRVLIVYYAWGDRAHREAFGHDYSYRTDSVMLIIRDAKINLACEWLLPEEYIKGRVPITKYEADWLIFRQTIKDHKKPKYSYWIYQPMYLGVKVGGDSSFHKKNVADHFKLDE